MAQTPALMYSDGDVIDYTPVSAVAAGDIPRALDRHEWRRAGI